MPAVSASAPAKIILLGEHAVVYNQPAIAVPVSELRARAAILANPLGKSGSVEIISKQENLQINLSELSQDHAFSRLLTAFCETAGISHLPAMQITISSEIPVASGMGSGAAVSVAVLRALAMFFGLQLDNRQISDMAFEAEKAYHGTPSGIDNCVIANETPIYFLRNQPLVFLNLPTGFLLLIANSGSPSKTIETVNAVRRLHELETKVTDTRFQQLGEVVNLGRVYLESGQPEKLGPIINQSHVILRELGVSTPQLDNLVSTAQQAGALGAKLSGGGGGGNIIALVKEDNMGFVQRALTEAGATQVFTTWVNQTNKGPN